MDELLDRVRSFSGGHMPDVFEARVVDLFERRGGMTSDPAQIGQATVLVWRCIAEALTPSLGRDTVAALFRCSLAMAVRRSPTLVTVAHDDADVAASLVSLCGTLASLSGADARAAARVFFHLFCESSTRIVGASMLSALLRAEWDVG